MQREDTNNNIAPPGSPPNRQKTQPAQGNIKEQRRNAVKDASDMLLSRRRSNNGRRRVGRTLKF